MQRKIKYISQCFEIFNGSFLFVGQTLLIGHFSDGNYQGRDINVLASGTHAKNSASVKPRKNKDFLTLILEILRYWKKCKTQKIQ